MDFCKFIRQSNAATPLSLANAPSLNSMLGTGRENFSAVVSKGQCCGMRNFFTTRPSSKVMTAKIAGKKTEVRKYERWWGS